MYLSIPASYYQLNGSAPFKIAHHHSDSGIDMLTVGCTRHQGLRNDMQGMYSTNTLWLSNLVDTIQS